MKRKVFLMILVVLLLVAALFVPIPKGPYKDGGTREYAALTYKVVDWNRISADGVYDVTKTYWFPDSLKSIDDLWAEYEEEKVVHKFVATVLELSGSYVLVEPVEGEDELRSSDQISFSMPGLTDLGIEVGSDVEVYYDGLIMETYPAKVNARKCIPATTLRHKAYDGQWLD